MEGLIQTRYELTVTWKRPPAVKERNALSRTIHSNGGLLHRRRTQANNAARAIVAANDLVEGVEVTKVIRRFSNFVRRDSKGKVKEYRRA